MNYIPRKIATNLTQTLARGKSVLLLGARQTGKTTLINHQIIPDITYSFAHVATRQRYEQNPALLEKELEERVKQYAKPPIIFIDEVQKIPRVMDVAQYLIDQKLAKFILTGSSARKLKTGHDLNLLPGRVVSLTMTPLIYDEMPEPKPALESILLYGALPGILLETETNSKDTDLYSYISTYLEEEIRAEAMTRNIGLFSRFLEVAAGESGKQLNFTRLSQDIGISDTTIANYYQVLEDCLIVVRIDPIDHSITKRRLIRSPKYLFFDMGVRRACANEGTKLSQKAMADLFEQYVGTELVYHGYLTSPDIKIRYWRDSAGPEIDYVIDQTKTYIPIEVKWTDKPSLADAKHLKKFIEEYQKYNVQHAYIVCRTPQRYKLAENIIALPWQEIGTIWQK